MKKTLFVIFLLLFNLEIYSQTCPTPTSSGVFVTMDATYQLGSVSNGETNVGLCFYNNTTQLVTAYQFRVYYDNAAFSSVSDVVSLNTSFSQELKFVDNNASGYVTITLTYTGNQNTFSIPNGPSVKLVLTHSNSFAGLNAVAPMSFTGTQTFPNLSTSQPGLDISLNLENFGGIFQPVTFTYAGTFLNVNGSGAKNIHVSLERKLKTGGPWSQVSSVSSNVNGIFEFNQISVDTTGYDVRLKVQGDTLSVGNVISVSDAQKINRFLLGIETPVGFDFYSSDVNGNNTITISDVYGVFGRVSGRFTSWPNNVKDVKFFTQAEFNSINGSSSNFTSTIPGVTNFIYNITSDSPSNLIYYVLVPGDANQTGFQMARMVPLEITNPNLSPFNIIDKTNQYDNSNLGSIELRFPTTISVNELNLVNVPVYVKTNNNNVGSLQFSLKYNSELLNFRGIVSNSSVSRWVSYLNPNDNEIEWGGYDPTNNQNILTDNSQVFTLQFTSNTIPSDWAQGPLYVSKKFAGDNLSYDLKIIPSQGIVSVGRLSGANILLDNKDMIVFPNPTDDLITVRFYVENKGNVWLSLFDMGGGQLKTIINDHMPSGNYSYTTNIGYLPSGTYIVVLNKQNTINSKKIIKN
jgi:hypothetical protein